MSAPTSYSPDIIRLLAKSGADINIRNHAGEAPLRVAKREVLQAGRHRHFAVSPLSERGNPVVVMPVSADVLCHPLGKYRLDLSVVFRAEMLHAPCANVSRVFILELVRYRPDLAGRHYRMNRTPDEVRTRVVTRSDGYCAPHRHVRRPRRERTPHGALQEHEDPLVLGRPVFIDHVVVESQGGGAVNVSPRRSSYALDRSAVLLASRNSRKGAVTCTSRFLRLTFPQTSRLKGTWQRCRTSP